MTGKGEVVGGVQGPVLGADLGCCLQREGLEALHCPPVPHTSCSLSCVSLLISPCPRVSWPLATAAAAPMDRPARDSAADAHSLARACYVCLPLSHLLGPHGAGHLPSAGALRTSHSSAQTELQQIPYDQPLKVAALWPSGHPLLDHALLPPDPIT